MKYGYYPGCSLHSTGQEFDKSFKAVCHKLGVELVELEKWVCCGASAVHNLSQLMAIAFTVLFTPLLPLPIVAQLLPFHIAR